MRRETKKLVTFISLSYLLAWSLWIPLAIAGVTTRQGIGWPSHMYGLLAPLVAALVTTFIFDGSAGVKRLLQGCIRWRIGWNWLAVVILVVAAVVALLVTGAHFSLSQLFVYSGLPSVLGPAATFVAVLVINGYGEEVGWRGFFVDSLLKRYSLLKTALVTTIVWAMWHIPLFFIVASFKDFGVGGIIGWTLGLTAGSILLTWLYKNSGGSILLVALWHTLFNFTSATQATADVLAPITSTLVMVAAVVLIWRERTAKRLKKQHP